MQNVKALVLYGFGLNCDHETKFAFEKAGATGHRVHINDLKNIQLENYQILAFSGGFSWGDDHGAGVLHAIRIITYLKEDIIRFLDNGKLIIGICNGFQVLVNMGLLPGIDNYNSRSVALTYNECGNFRDDWVNLSVNSKSLCVFTKDMEMLELPIRHGEGKFFTDNNTAEKLIDNQQIVLQYANKDGKPANNKFPYNPNGSLYDIAGICDKTGRVFGLMPHPEAFNHITNHPGWTRQFEIEKRMNLNHENWFNSNNLTQGIKIFKNAVDYIQNNNVI